MHAAAHLATILVVEDHPEVVCLLQHVLGEHGYAVRSACDGEAGIVSALEDEPDLLILDVGLPHRSGLEVVQELRRRGMESPTLMLTALNGVADRVSGLEAGADDYLGKPFDNEELIARVRALLRRSTTRPRVPVLRVGDVRLNVMTHTGYRGDRSFQLTEKEFALLECFLRNSGRPLTRSQIARM